MKKYNYKTFLNRMELHFHPMLSKFSLVIDYDIVCFITYPVTEDKILAAYRDYKTNDLTFTP